MNAVQLFALLTAAALVLTTNVVDASPSYAKDERASVRPSPAIRFIHSQMCVDVPRKSKANGVRLQQYPCRSGTRADTWNQRWGFLCVEHCNGSEGGRYYIVRNANSKLCMKVAGGSEQPGAKVIQSSNCNSDSSRWALIPCDGVSSSKGTSGRVYSLKNKKGYATLDVPGRSLAAGTKLIQYSPKACFYTNEMFELVNP
ncbi:RICIN domain-containing protein [Dactylosporangium sp. NPDC050688]|uniref:RICIN domain-containing protein n=1 Tax=Dactylosporangium sp. NPDC050688 TaxID=3157217 RepID=UPI003402FC90